MPEIISRKEARARGLKHYFTGKPCKHGHLDLRYTKDRQCFRCGTDWSAKWRSKNLEHIRSYQQKERRGDPEKVRERSRRSHAKHIKKRNAAAREYNRRIRDLLAVLRIEMPDLMKEFGL